MERWQYRIVTRDMEGWFAKRLPEEETRAELDDLGNQGWELAGVVPVTGEGFTTRSMVLYFKRQIS